MSSFNTYGENQDSQLYDSYGVGTRERGKVTEILQTSLLGRNY